MNENIFFEAIFTEDTRTAYAGTGGCFISTSQEAFNQDVMQGLTFIGTLWFFGD